MLLGLFIKLTVHLGSLSTLLSGVWEAAQAVKFHVTDKISQAVKLLDSLCGEACDKGSSQDNSGNLFTYLLYKRPESLLIAGTVHLFQDILIAVLNGHIYVLDDLVLSCHNVQQLVGNALGIAVQHSYPLELRNGAELFKQLGK